MIKFTKIINIFVTNVKVFVMSLMSGFEKEVMKTPETMLDEYQDILKEQSTVLFYYTQELKELDIINSRDADILDSLISDSIEYLNNQPKDTPLPVIVDKYNRTIKIFNDLIVSIGSMSGVVSQYTYNRFKYQLFLLSNLVLEAN